MSEGWFASIILISLGTDSDQKVGKRLRSILARVFETTTKLARYSAYRY